MVIVVLSATDCVSTSPRRAGSSARSRRPAPAPPARRRRQRSLDVDADRRRPDPAEPGDRLGHADAPAAGGAGDADDLAAPHGEARRPESPSPDISLDLERHRRAGRDRPPDGIGKRESAPARRSSPRSASSFGSSATGAVMMWRASRSTVTAWQISYTSCRWCEMNRKVTPCACSSRMRPKSRLISSPSSCAVGSSRMMNRAP